MTRNSLFAKAAMLTALSLLGVAARLTSADPHDSPAHRPLPPPPPHQHFDARFSHNHAYYNHGFVVHDLPHDHVVINHGPSRYYYSAGVWYAPHGPSFVVVAPPIGVFVPVLPPFYSTVWFGGVPYYYANDAYYTWSDQDHGYQVVDPPAGAVDAAPDAQPPQLPTTTQLFIYPRTGQSADQQSRDKYECHAWAMGQTGFDPTAAGGNVSADQFTAKSADYYRAMASCLQGRGYSVE